MVDFSQSYGEIYVHSQTFRIDFVVGEQLYPVPRSLRQTKGNHRELVMEVFNLMMSLFVGGGKNFIHQDRVDHSADTPVDVVTFGLELFLEADEELPEQNNLYTILGI